MHTDPNILTKRSAKELRGHFSTGASPMFSSGSLTSMFFSQWLFQELFSLKCKWIGNVCLPDELTHPIYLNNLKI